MEGNTTDPYHKGSQNYMARRVWRSLGSEVTQIRRATEREAPASASTTTAGK